MKENNVSEQVAQLANLFSEPTRVRIVMLLTKEPNGLTTSDICTRLGLLQPRVSTHLATLLKQGAVSVSDRGRQRIYRLSSDRVASVLEDLVAFFPQRKRMSLLTSEYTKKCPDSNSEIRQCRTCYDHLAGVAGVELLDEIVSAGWLTKDNVGPRRTSKPFYRMTRIGSDSLKLRGVDLDEALRSSRIFAYGCLDWTENRPHLGGSLGAAILDSILKRGIVERKKGTRALKVLAPIPSWLGQLKLE